MVIEDRGIAPSQNNTMAIFPVGSPDHIDDIHAMKMREMKGIAKELCCTGSYHSFLTWLTQFNVGQV